MTKTKRETKTQPHRKFVSGRRNKTYHAGKSLLFVRKENGVGVRAETDEEFMRRHGVYEKLLAQIKTAIPSKNLKAELDEL